MLTLSIIDDILESNFNDSTISKGEKYFYGDRIISYDYNEDLTVASAVIKGSKNKTYKVSLEYNGSFMSSCGCPMNHDCKHVVALLYQLEELIEETDADDALRMLQNSLFENKKGKLTKTTNQSKQKSKKVKKEKFRSNEYRLLNFNNDNRLVDFVHENSPKYFERLSWNDEYQGVFINPNELKIDAIYGNHYSRKRPASIVLKRDENGVSVKCLTCSKNVVNLCEHQCMLLSEAANKIQSSGFLKGNLTYQKIVVDAKKKTGVNPDAFDKYFSVIFSKYGFQISSKTGNYGGNDWIQKAGEFINNSKKENKAYIQNELDTLNENRQKKYAYYWTNKSAKITQLLFVSGLGLKTKEGIQNKGKTVSELPSNIPEPYKSIGQDLFFATNEKLAKDRFNLVKTIILNNTDTLSEIYHYVIDGEDRSYHSENIPASRLKLIQFHPTKLDCRIKIEKVDGLLHAKLLVTLDDKSFPINDLSYTNNYFSVKNGKAYLHPNEKFWELLQLFNGKDNLLLPKTTKKDITEFTANFRKYFNIEVEDKLILKERLLVNPRYQILLREAGQFILFEPRLKYDDYSFNAFEEGSFAIDKQLFVLDKNDQQFLINFLKNAHPAFDNDFQVQEYTYLNVNEMLKNQWFFTFGDLCTDASIEILGQENLTNFKFNNKRAKTYTHIKSGIDWFDVDMGVSFGEEKIPTADWIRALRNKETFVTLKDGTLGILPEEWLKKATNILAVSEVNKGMLQISKYRYNVIEDLFDNIDDKKILKELAERKKRLLEIDTSKKYKVPKIVNAELRDYQKHGYTWLKFLDESGFGGILADDMGLGKTLQIICLLADKIKGPPSLVIVPRSLLYNWAEEIDKFCPSLIYTIHHGQGRAKEIRKLESLNVIISTYGTVAQDIELLKSFKFNYIILDESQAIKNPDSQRYKAMRLLQSNNKIAMTGTPIENNTFDLYAQLSFTAPGLLGSKNSFKNSFSIPIDNQGDLEAAALLRKLIHPFMLRRTKDQVAKDLPEKTETVIYCEMGDHQRRLYNNLKAKIKEDIEAEVEEKGIAKSKFRMLDGLLRLRQMCNSPLLINKSFKGANAESVKINLLLSHLDEQLKKHNALLFSQFVSLLSIVRKELDKRGIPYAYLDGSTTNRKAEVDKFMNNDEVKIFLISIKAGNTGMNLTKADYVYILDPWWNPAVEAQAIDRTHRIGQDKQIFAYKMICKDSIEEKILKLQQKKRKLADDIIRTDENIMKSLKKDDLMALFD